MSKVPHYLKGGQAHVCMPLSVTVGAPCQQPVLRHVMVNTPDWVPSEVAESRLLLAIKAIRVTRRYHAMRQTLCRMFNPGHQHAA